MEVKSKGGHKVTINYKALDKAKMFARALKNPLRKKILGLLSAEKEVRVTDIYRKLDIQQNVASSHLRILKDEDILIAREQGKEVYYSINTMAIHRVNEILKTL